MDLVFWARVFQWITAVGGVLVVLGTLGYYRVKSVAERQTRELHAAQVQHLTERVEQLSHNNQEYRQKLAPFESIAEWKYPKASDPLTKLKSGLESVRTRAREIEAKLAPRSLPGHVISRMIESLKKFPGQRVQLMCPEGNQEALQFADQMKNVFREAGWDVEEPAQAVFNQPVSGIILMVDRKPAPAAADTLAELLRDAGFGVSGQLNYSLGNRLRVIVGSKP